MFTERYGGNGSPRCETIQSFEMSRLIKHWKGTDPELSWIKIEQELVCPFKPLDEYLTKDNHTPLYGTTRLYLLGKKLTGINGLQKGNTK